MKSTRVLSSCIASLLAVSYMIAEANDDGEAPPADPFDYSYCGGKPMYPVIGLNFSTACGPRNQVALGRRGRLMWLYPKSEGQVHSQGERQLSRVELADLVFLAQAAQLAGTPVPRHGRVMYDLGINFSGQANKRAHGSLEARDQPDAVQALSAAMRKLIPEQPLLPDCAIVSGDFSPTELPRLRQRNADP